MAGKTGTATNGPGRAPNAWFVAFAPAGPNDIPRIAVAVIVLDGGDLGNEATGGLVAAPIAREVIAAFLARGMNTGDEFVSDDRCWAADTGSRRGSVRAAWPRSTAGSTPS